MNTMTEEREPAIEPVCECPHKAAGRYLPAERVRCPVEALVDSSEPTMLTYVKRDVFRGMTRSCQCANQSPCGVIPSLL